MLYAIFRYLLVPFFFLAYRPRINGLQHLRVKGKAIFVCNHVSMMDPIALALISPRFIHFMAKSDLFKNPLANLFLRSFLAFPVNRKQADMTSLKNAMKVLDQGKVFGIFPEGKRSITDDLDELEKGAAFLAIRSGAPVVPIYIDPASYRKWKMRVLIGKPLYPSGLVASAPKSKLVDVVTDEISDALSALKMELNP